MLTARFPPQIRAQTRHRRAPLVGLLLALFVAVSAPVAACGAGASLGLPAPTPERAQSGVLEGLCEASTIVPWEGGYLIGDNETPDRLFLFGADLSPRGTVPLTAPIEDIEAVAHDGDRLWVVGSQSTTKKGKVHPAREQSGYLGEPTRRVDFAGCPACEAARGRAPEDGGLNVEGAAVLAGRRWLGLRAPLVDGKAPLLMLTPDGGAVERTDLLDLGGYGVRELTPWRGGLLVVAGPVSDEAAPHRLYWLPDIQGAPKPLPVELPASTEGLAAAEDGDTILVTDGSGQAGTICEQASTWHRIQLSEPQSR